jgi:hypothetical protein
VISNPFLPSPPGCFVRAEGFLKAFVAVAARITKVPHRQIAQTASKRLPAICVADALGLDFLNSVATPVDTQIDRIDDGLLAWLE